MSRILFALVAALSLVGGAHAITNGQPDAGAHPYVGELFLYGPTEIDPRFTDPGAWFGCSATLITPTIAVTAGHCVTGVGRNGAATTDCTSLSGSACGNDMWVNFSEAPDFSGLPPSSHYIPDKNAQRYTDRAAYLATQPAWIRATVYVHPEFSSGPFLLHDVGVLVLSRPVTMTTYGKLPAEGYLDQYLTQRRNSQRFTPVGYGLEKSGPHSAVGGDTRLKGSAMLISLVGGGIDYGTIVRFTNNHGTTHKGGTCYGDSGGPVFDGDTNQIVAITSFGQGPNCTGIDGAYRIDQPDDIEFMQQFLQ